MHDQTKTKKIKGLIFDLDGTVTLTQQYHAEAYAKVLGEFGIIYTKEEDQQKYAGKGSDIIFPEVFKAHGIKVDAQTLETCKEEKKKYYDEIIATTEIETVDGIKEFLDKAQAENLKMIIATGNKLDSVKNILDKTGLHKFFEDICTNKDVKNPKPAPDLFLFAAEKLNLNPAECIVFEDALNGVAAAKAGGFKCIALSTGESVQNLQNAGADKVVSSYTEITDKDLN